MREDVIWMLVGVALIIAEMVLPSFFLMSFGIGAVVTALATYFGAPFVWQWRIFVVVSAVLVLATRRLAGKVLRGSGHRSNIDAYLGETAVVLERIDSSANSGRVRVQKEEWRADSAEIIEEGALVEVTGADGAHLKVRRKNA